MLRPTRLQRRLEHSRGRGIKHSRRRRFRSLGKLAEVVVACLLFPIIIALKLYNKFNDWKFYRNYERVKRGNTVNPNNSTVDMVLTSIVNNKNVLSTIAKDMESRFNMVVDIDKLEGYLNTVEIDAKPNIMLT